MLEIHEKSWMVRIKANQNYSYKILFLKSELHQKTASMQPRLLLEKKNVFLLTHMFFNKTFTLLFMNLNISFNKQPHLW